MLQSCHSVPNETLELPIQTFIDPYRPASTYIDLYRPILNEYLREPQQMLQSRHSVPYKKP